MLGIRFAPINVSMERRLQTFVVFCELFMMILLGPVCSLLFIYVLLFTRFYWLVLIYAAIRFYERDLPSKGGRPSNWVRHLKWWHYYRDYFPIKLYKTADLDPSRNYVLGVFPHGIFACGASLSLGSEALNVNELFPGVKLSLGVMDLFFKLPGVRELMLAHGGCSVSKESLNYILSHPEGGRAVVLAVGGAEEALLSRPGNVNIVLKKRKGFVKLALRNGASLLPVFSFGENELFDQMANPEGSWLRLAQEFCKQYTSFAPPILIGRGFFQYTFGCMPRRKPINVVVGTPIETLKVDEPTETQINELHNRFIKELTELFEKEKHKYIENPKNTYLVVR